MSALALYVPPPAIARAWEQRHYTSLQLEAHIEAMDRKRRMNGPLAAAAEALAPPPPPSAPIVRARPAKRPERLPDAAYIVKDEVAASFGLAGGVNELLVSCRRSRVSVPRMTAMWAHKQVFPNVSLPGLGRAFPALDGRGRDHTTALNAIRRTEQRLRDDSAFAEFAAEILARVKARLAARQLLADANAENAKAAAAEKAAAIRARAEQEAKDEKRRCFSDHFHAVYSRARRARLRAEFAAGNRPHEHQAIPAEPSASETTPITHDARKPEEVLK